MKYIKKTTKKLWEDLLYDIKENNLIKKMIFSFLLGVHHASLIVLIAIIQYR